MAQDITDDHGKGVLDSIARLLEDVLTLERRAGHPHCLRLGSADVHLSAGDGHESDHGPAPEAATIAQATSVLVHDVPETAELLEAINELNRRARLVRVFLAEGCVYAVADIVAAVAGDPHALAAVCSHLADFADYYDGKLRKEFGGRRALDAPDGCVLCAA